MTKSIINIEDGSFILKDDFIIKRGDLYNEVLASAVKYDLSNPETDIIDYNNGYKWLTVKYIESKSLFFYFAICFKNEEVDRIFFGFSKTKCEKTWDDWSEEKELLLKKEYSEWLRKEIGEYLKFKWGNIGVYYDRKSGGTDMYVIYKDELLNDL